MDTSFRKLKIVVDCANGAAYEVAPAVLRRLGAEGDRDERSAERVEYQSTSAARLTWKGCSRRYVDHQADLGIGHDGDADRCLAVDELGQMVDGDQIMTICALEMLKAGKLPAGTLVATVMSNIGLHQAIKRAGGKIVVTPVGDRYVLETMLTHGYGLGGEQSGHIIFSEHSTTGDGVLTAIQLISALAKTGKKLSELAGLMTRFPQVLFNVRLKNKAGWDENGNIAAAIQAVEAQLGEDGRVLVRPSGTEPLIRVMAEGPSLPQLENLVEQIAVTIRKEMGS